VSGLTFQQAHNDEFELLMFYLFFKQKTTWLVNTVCLHSANAEFN